MKQLLSLIALTLLMGPCFSQTSDTTVVNGDTFITVYQNSTADSLLRAGDFKSAIQRYKEAYKSEGKNFNQFYNYACALSLDRQADSAFKYLTLAVKQSPTPDAFCDADFFNLRKDKKWGQFEADLIADIQKKNDNPYKDIGYAKQLWYMSATDQAYYDCLDVATDKIGRNSRIVNAIWYLKELLNEENRKKRLAQGIASR